MQHPAAQKPQLDAAKKSPEKPENKRVAQRF